jgi:hypothetical protein
MEKLPPWERWPVRHSLSDGGHPAGKAIIDGHISDNHRSSIPRDYTFDKQLREKAIQAFPGERARPGRSETRPRGSPLRVKMFNDPRLSHAVSVRREAHRTVPEAGALPFLKGFRGVS